MKRNQLVVCLAILTIAFGLSQDGLAKSKDGSAKSKRRTRARKYYPPLTHPVVLWARTLSKSVDTAERKKAAFKLSAYTQQIFQEEVVTTLVTCSKDTDVEIKVLCTKALGRAGSHSQSDKIRKVLVDLYQNDPTLRNTVVRTFMTRKETSPEVHYALLESARGSSNPEDVQVLLTYFETFGTGSDKFVDGLVEIYKTSSNAKIQRSVVKALGDRAKGQEKVIEILAGCADHKDTPLALTCISGLQIQATKDKRSWVAAEKTLLSSDPDVQDATLDLINSLPETVNGNLSKRLVEIIDESEDPQIQEKAVMALGVSGDRGEPIVKTLQKILEGKDSDDSTRVAAALVLGKQTDLFPDKSQELLAKCTNAGSQSLKTACSLGLKELESRKAAGNRASASTPSTAGKP